MTLTTQTVRAKVLPVAVVDTFRRGMRKGGLATSHGEFVEAFIGTELQTIRFDTSKYKEGDLENSWQRFSLAFKELIEKIKDGLKISALNLSSSFSAPIDFLSEIFDMELNTFNLSENKNNLREKIFDMPFQSKKIKDEVEANRFIRAITNKRNVNPKSVKEETIDFKEIVKRGKTLCEMIEYLEKIRKLGIQVFISAGNEGKNMVNLLSLTEDAHVVGAGNATQMESYSCDNDLVNAHELGTFYLARRKNYRQQKDVLSVNLEGTREISGNSIGGYDLNQELCGRRVEVANGYIPHSYDFHWQLHPITKLQNLIQRSVREDPRLYNESDISLFQSAPEKGMHFVLGDHPIDIMFFDDIKGIITECTKFTYPLFGTSYATPLFLRKYLMRPVMDEV